MLSPIDQYFSKHDEPVKSCLQYMRAHILGLDKNISETWQYGMPFYLYKKKRLCYLWVHKKLDVPYLGIVDGKLIEHPDLIQENRARMKIFLLDPNKDVPIRKVNSVLKMVIELYK